jgi:hypothetical protein
MKAEASIPKKPWVAALTTLGTALLCNACCWLPPVVIALTGSGAGLVSFIHPYRPYLIAFTAVQLAIGLWLVYRKPKTHHCVTHGAECHHDHRANRTMNIRIMWGVVAFVVALNVWDTTHHHDAATPKPPIVAHKA